MSLTQLYNEKQILGACRTYRRATRHLARVEQAPHTLDRAKELHDAKEKVLEIRDRLLYFVETGSRSYPHVGKR